MSDITVDHETRKSARKKKNAASEQLKEASFWDHKIFAWQEGDYLTGIGRNSSYTDQPGDICLTYFDASLLI